MNSFREYDSTFTPEIGLKFTFIKNAASQSASEFKTIKYFLYFNALTSFELIVKKFNQACINGGVSITQVITAYFTHLSLADVLLQIEFLLVTSLY